MRAAAGIRAPRADAHRRIYAKAKAIDVDVSANGEYAFGRIDLGPCGSQLTTNELEQDPESGEWRLDTVMPGRVPFPGGGMQAPHIALWVTARGINIGLHTRIYFEGHATDEDPLLARIDLRQRVATLVAKAGGDVWRHDIVLQGENETVFLDI